MRGRIVDCSYDLERILMILSYYLYSLFQQLLEEYPTLAVKFSLSTMTISYIPIIRAKGVANLPLIEVNLADLT